MLKHLPLPLFAIALVALYLGERTLNGTPRLAVDSAAALALVAALAIALGRALRSTAERRRAYGWAAGAYLLALAGLGLYGLTLAPVPWGTWTRAPVLLQAAWPAVLLLGLLPAAAMEQSIASMLRTPTLELWRVRLAARAARIVVLALVAFAGFNYAANVWNRKIDLSYFKTTQVGSATRAIAEHLSQPVQFVLFFPPGNEVLDQARSYLDELASASPQVHVEVLDQALEPERAKALQVRANGYLAIVAGTNHEVLRLELDAEEARGVLRTLDGEVQQRLLKVIRPERIAYLTTGHMERDYAPLADDRRAGLADLKGLLEAQGFAVRRLGLAEGLGREVPKDATLVMVVGPTEPFSAPERDALQRYLAAGGRALIAVDPDHGGTEDALLAGLGVQVGRSLVAAPPQYRVRVEGHRESPYDMASTRASTHPVVATLAHNPGRLFTVFLGAGGVTKAPGAAAELNVTMALHAMPGTWEDVNGNGQLDAGKEGRASLELLAAVERVPVAKAAGAGEKGADGAAGGKGDDDDDDDDDDDGDEDDGEDEVAAGGGAATTGSGAGGAREGATRTAAGAAEPAAELAAKPATMRALRAVVAGDADWLADGIVRNPGNAYVVSDLVRWLAGAEEDGGVTESEKDVPLVQRRDNDVIWFYGVSFLVPAAVAIAGLTFTGRAGRRRGD